MLNNIAIKGKFRQTDNFKVYGKGLRQQKNASKHSLLEAATLPFLYPLQGKLV